MADPEHTALAERLTRRMTQIADGDLAAWTRPDLEGLSFAQLEPVLSRIQTGVRAVANAPTDDLPKPLLLSVSRAFDELEPRLDELKYFNVLNIAQQRNEPTQVRQNYLNQFGGAEARFWEWFAPFAAYVTAEGLRRTPDRAKAALESAVREATNGREAVTRLQSDLEHVVEAARSAAANVGVAKHAGLFASEAKAFERESFRWFWATAFAAAITLIAVGVNLWYTISRSDPGKWDVQLIVAKVLGFSLLLSATVWCGRMFRAARHNWVVNRHRQNALGSFETFVQGASDESTKNAVLLHAAQSIFQMQQTGYGGGDSDPSSPSTLIEVVRTIAPPK